MAPTLYQGKVYVGSDDGYVYCLDADSGQLVWSHCPAGVNRRIPGNGRLISVWPVRLGIVVEKDVAYVCAGFFPNQGVFLCALDAHTGKAIWTQQTDVSSQGYMRCSPTHLLVPTGSTLLLGSEDKVTALSADTGHVKWTSPVKGKAYGLAVANGRLFASTDQGTIHCFGQTRINHPDQSLGKPSLVEWPGGRQTQGVKLLARDIIQQSTMAKGYCLVLGSGTGQLACELAQQSDLSIVGVEEDALAVRKAREQISAAGLYGDRLCIFQGSPKKLPFQDYVANLIVCDLSRTKVDRLPEASELHRVLSPGRGALVMVHPGETSTEQRLRMWAQNVFNGCCE